VIGMSESERKEITKVNVPKDIKRVIRRIAADKEQFEYQIVEEAIREKHPEYFKE
jgi:hypothetical protein